MAKRIDVAEMLEREEVVDGDGPAPLALNPDGSLPESYRQSERTRSLEIVAARAKRRDGKATQ
jgi:hypothetical protein